MARIVISGVCDSPHWAKIEILSDHLAKNLDSFYVKKIIKKREEWSQWKDLIFFKNGWNLKRNKYNDVFVWRELLSRGGKGTIIGDYNDYQEYTHVYYSETVSILTNELVDIAKYNHEHKIKQIKLKKDVEISKTIIKIGISCLNNEIKCSAICTLLSQFLVGSYPKNFYSINFIYNEKTKVNSENVDTLESELFDLAHSNISQILHRDIVGVFEDSNFLFLIDSLTIIDNESRENYINRVYSHYSIIADSVCNHAQRDCQIIISSDGPYHIICQALIDTFKGLKQNWRCNSFLLNNNRSIRTVKNIISKKIKNFAKNIVDLIDWSCPGVELDIDKKVKLIDLSQAKIYNQLDPVEGDQHFYLNLLKTINDKKWLSLDYMNLAKQNITRMYSSRPKYINEAHSICKSFFDWYGQKKEYVSMTSVVVPSNGSYNIENNIPFSFPAIIGPNGRINIIENVKLNHVISNGFPEIVERVQFLNAVIALRKIKFKNCFTRPRINDSIPLGGASSYLANTA
ncbi:putative malate dehydrogenase 1B [Intoshia linei]|uniref:Putative malate dehydrogenase 1B n=1 Tax=Intoshia linei TaxID=1819745 RepID=A0A177B6C4_9BILA|nr:putative malate dehydrogenase 1B [Intoshia linei]